MHTKKPIPFPNGEKPRRLCPVCGTVTYSVGGIHPQCAEELADSPRVERLKARKKAEKPKGKVANANALNAWHKRCPKCRTQVHVRKLTCGCGHQFS